MYWWKLKGFCRERIVYKNDKIQEVTDESEEMLKMKKNTSNQLHYETFSRKHDIKREVHRQENWQKTHGVGENKKILATSLISSDKKDRKMLNSVQVGLKKHSWLSTSKSDNMRYILKIKKPTSHFEDHLRCDVAGAKSLQAILRTIWGLMFLVQYL